MCCYISVVAFHITVWKRKEYKKNKKQINNVNYSRRWKIIETRYIVFNNNQKQFIIHNKI
jgi:hypothetical protein